MTYPNRLPYDTQAAPCCCLQQPNKCPYTCKSKPTHTQVMQCPAQARPSVSAPGVCLAQNYFAGICVCLFRHIRGMDMGRPWARICTAHSEGTSHATLPVRRKSQPWPAVQGLDRHDRSFESQLRPPKHVGLLQGGQLSGQGGQLSAIQTTRRPARICLRHRASRLLGCCRLQFKFLCCTP